MTALKICNVIGDGNCFYRCIWNIAQSRNDLCEALMIHHQNKDDENEGTQEVRDIVAIALRHDQVYVRANVERMLEFKKSECFDISEDCPLFAHLRDNLSVEENCERLANVVESTNTMASSFEKDIINNLFQEADVYIIVLTQLSGEDIGDLADKWLRHLHKYLFHVRENYLCILINQDSIHYKYCKFYDQLVFEKQKLQEYIDTKMTEASEDDDF